ncbi:MAG: hypothetical protein ACE5PT_11565 [Gemmatimonadales bacterium]
MPENSTIIEGKRFMWDGEDPSLEGSARERADRYQADGFETQLIEEGGMFLVYTRRVASSVPLEGSGS